MTFFRFTLVNFLECEKRVEKESVVDPFDGLDEILGDYANTGKQITEDASTWKQMVVHVVEEVHVNMNNFSFTAHPEHDTSIGAVDVQEDDLDVIDYDSFGSDLDDGIDSERRIQLRELRIIGKQKNKGPNKYYFYLGQQFASKEIVKRRVKKHSVEIRRQLILMKNDNERVRVRCEDTIPTLVPYVAIYNNIDKNVFSQTKGGLAISKNINSGKQNILDHVIKSLATNPVRAVQDQMQKKFEYSLLREYAQELINQNPSTTFQIDVQQEPNPESLTRIFRRVYVCLGALKQAVGVDANNRIYLVAYAIVEAESKASWYCVRHIHENMKSHFKGGVYKEMLWNAAKATYVGEFKKKIGELKSFNFDAYDWEWELTGIPWKHVVAAIYNMSENSVGVGIPEQWVHAAYRLETWAHVYSFKVNPCKLYRNGKSISCGKCGNVGHNRKGCRGQGGGSSQAGARKVSGQAAGSRKVSGQATGARNVSGQAAGARKASSQPSTAQSPANQGPRQGFQDQQQVQLLDHKERPRNLWIFEQYEFCLHSCK
nr:hypothetical protein [Tanacetum cinerariifolium]